MRQLFAAALFTSSVMLLAGCPSTTGANVPGMGDLLAGASPTPSPTVSTGPASASDCKAEKPALDPIKGTPAMGRYNGQGLPGDYGVYTTEEKVTEAIGKQENGPNWACFQKFYPGAVTVYLQNKPKK